MNISQKYDKFLGEFPFSTAAAVYRALGERIEDKYGGDCRDQVKAMKRKELVSMIVADRNSEHVAAIDENNRFFDPSWGIGPIRMRRQVKVSRSNYQFLYRKEKELFIGDRVQDPVLYEFDISKEAKRESSKVYRARAKFTTEQRVWISTYSGSGQDMSTLWHEGSWFYITRDMRGDNEKVIWDTSKRDFEQELEIIANRLGESPNTIKEFLIGAREKRKDIKID